MAIGPLTGAKALNTFQDCQRGQKAESKKIHCKFPANQKKLSSTFQLVIWDDQLIIFDKVGRVLITCGYTQA